MLAKLLSFFTCKTATHSLTTLIDELTANVSRLGVNARYRDCEAVCILTRNIWYRVHSKLMTDPGGAAAIIDRCCAEFERAAATLLQVNRSGFNQDQSDHVTAMADNIRNRVHKIGELRGRGRKVGTEGKDLAPARVAAVAG